MTEHQLDRDELIYRAQCQAIRRRYTLLKYGGLGVMVFGGPVAFVTAGWAGVMGVGAILVGGFFSANRGSDQDVDKIAGGHKELLKTHTPKRHHPDLYREFAPGAQQNPGLPARPQGSATPPPLMLRAEAHILLVGPTRSGKTSALAALVGEDDCVYVSLKRDRVPSGWKAYCLDPEHVDRDVSAVLDTVEPLTAALLRGERHGRFWFCVDEIVGIVGLCSKPLAERLLRQVKLRVTAGAAEGCMVGLLLQSPNASDLGLSAALLRNFQQVVLASERSGFGCFRSWAERFSPLDGETKTAIANLSSGYWAVSDGELCQPTPYKGELVAARMMRVDGVDDTVDAPSPEPQSASQPSSTASSTASSTKNEIACPHCHSQNTVKNGAGRRKCKSCQRTFPAPPSDPAESAAIIGGMV